MSKDGRRLSAARSRNAACGAVNIPQGRWLRMERLAPMYKINRKRLQTWMDDEYGTGETAVKAGVALYAGKTDKLWNILAVEKVIKSHQRKRRVASLMAGEWYDLTKEYHGDNEGRRKIYRTQLKKGH